MATTFIKGTFTRQDGVGQQIIDTSSGIEGKALILFWTRQTGTGYDATAGHKIGGIGFATSSTRRGCTAFAVECAATTTNTGKSYFANRIIEVFSDSTPTEESVADFVSFGTGANAGKFTLDWTINPAGASAITIHYIFLAGIDITNTFVGDFVGPTATGNQAFTGVGFRGKLGIFLSTNQTSAATSTGLSFSMGAAESTTNRWAWSVACNDGQATDITREMYGSNTLCLVTEKHGSVVGDLASDNKADFVSWDSDGFTLNYSKVTTSSIKFLGLILGGTFSSKISYFRTPGYDQAGVEGATQAVSIGFKPQGTIFSSNALWLSSQPDTEDIADIAIIIGAATTSTQGCIDIDIDNPGASHETAASHGTVTNRIWTTTDADFPTSTSSTPEKALSYISTNDDGFTYKEEDITDPNVDLGDVTLQDFVFYVSLGDGGQPAPSGLRVKRGVLYIRDSQFFDTGQTVVTGLDFQPKALIVMRSLSDGTTTFPWEVWQGTIRMELGFATRRGGSTQQGCVFYGQNDNVSTTAASRQTRNDSIGVYSTNTLTLTTFDIEGFTVGHPTALRGEALHYIAIGGPDLSDANVVMPTMNTTGATQAITGVGFMPTVALFLYAQTAHSTTSSSNAMISFGAASSPTDEWCISTAGNSGVTTTGAMNWVKVIRTDACMYSFLSDGTEDAKWNLASFDNDGLTLNIDNLPGTASTIPIILCLKGGKYKVGTKAKTTGGAPIDDVFTGVGFKSNGILFANTHQTSVNTIEVHENFSVGAATSKDGSQEGSEPFVGADATLPTQEDTYSSNSKAVITALHGATPAVQAQADMKSFESDGFTINWTTNDAVADIIAYLAFGPLTRQSNAVAGFWM